MKYAFLTLLLLNILYALWEWQERVPQVGWPGLESEPELVDQAPAVVSSAAPELQQPLSQSLAPALCVTLGRFASANEAQQLRQRLLVLDIPAEVRPREVVMATDYWLVMPVVGGERHAVLQLSALQEQGVESFLITQGEMAGQLSLGVFHRQDHAELRREQMQAQGHDVQVHALSRKDRQFVVEVSGAARRLVDQGLLSRLRADFPSLLHQYQPCSPVAIGEQIP